MTPVAMKSTKPSARRPAAEGRITPLEPAVPGVPAELQMLRVPEVADVLAISPRQVWRLVRDGVLPAYHPSPGATRIALADLRRYLERCRD